jgi:hypothetical protein
VSATSRNWDRSPESERDKRFHDLRESGYTGPIDENGNADTTSEGAAILRRMAQRRGETVAW